MFGVSLTKIKMEEAKLYLAMQQEAFRPLYERYRDEGSPFLEPLSKMEARLENPIVDSYWIWEGEARAGSIWVIRQGVWDFAFYLARLFILPKLQGRGLAQAAIRLVEEMYGPGRWGVDTIAEEPGNCYLYEKMGYHPTGRLQPVNERLTLIFYEKTVE